MKVLDATFLVDYLAGVDATADYLLDHENERFVLPAPAFAEVLVGEGNPPRGTFARREPSSPGETWSRRTSGPR
jgi:hypothetical protein